MLHYNPNIEALKISRCKFSAHQLVQIVETIVTANCLNLRRLEFTQMQVDQSVMHALSVMLERNRSMQRLEIERG